MKTNNLNIHLTVFFLLLSLILFLSQSKAETIIWQIGDIDGSGQEFVLADQKSINYQVPSDWDSLLSKGSPSWGGFPAKIYTKGSQEDSPQELWINFTYQQDYGNPELVIIAAIDPNAPPCFLEIYKAEIFIGWSPINGEIFTTSITPLGYIKKGEHEKNRIVLQCSGQPDTPIFFDALYLFIDFTDTDGDGVSDKDEGKDEGDDSYLYPDRAFIPLKSYNPMMINKLSLHLEKSEGLTPYLRQVRFLDQSSMILPDWLLSGYYLPYEFLGFRIGGITEKERVKTFIDYFNPLYPSARFYFYQANQAWEGMAFELIDDFTAGIILEDGGAGDLDGLADGNINSVFTLAYPETLKIKPEKRGCFIETTLEVNGQRSFFPPAPQGRFIETILGRGYEKGF